MNYFTSHEDVLWNGSIVPPFFISALNVGELSVLLPGRFIAGERSPVPIGQEAGWAPELD
jgi:hypothetical protein